MYFRELPRVFKPQSFLHHPLLLWTAPPVQVAKTPVDPCCVLEENCFDSDFSFVSFREPGVWALERAKQNVLENYLLVGILEELEDVLLLLERLLPHYFSGVLNIYKTPGGCRLYSRFKILQLRLKVIDLILTFAVLFVDYKKMGNLTGTVRKHTPSLEALQVLYHRMRYEYNFYNFIRDQFHLMKKKIGLTSASVPTAYSPAFLRELALRTPEPLDENEELDGELEDANSWLVQP